jgi:hypothetical protein
MTALVGILFYAAVALSERVLLRHKMPPGAEVWERARD